MYKSNLDNLDFGDKMLYIQSVFLGLTIFGRGFLFFTSQELVLHDTPFYKELHEVMPLSVWGIVLMVSALVLIISAFFVAKIKVNRVFYGLIFIGGVASSFIYMIMTTAAMFNNINWLTPFNLILTACWTGLMGVFGGYEYAKRK